MLWNPEASGRKISLASEKKLAYAIFHDKHNRVDSLCARYKDMTIAL